MTMFTIPAETFRDLLWNVEGEISAASPFAFLLAGEPEPDLEASLPWLEEQGLLQSDLGDGDRPALIPALRHSLEIVTRPIRRVTVGEVRPDGVSRAVYFSDGEDVVVAMFDQENCIVSEPVGLAAFHSGLVEAVGVGTETTRRPLQIHPAGLTLFGVLVGPMRPEDEGDLSGGRGPDDISWPLERGEAKDRLEEVLEEEQLAESLLEGFVNDRILAARNGKFELHADFRPWHRALVSGHYLELQRMEFPGSRLEDALLPVSATFLGPAGERVLLWPASDDSGDILLTVPNEKELSEVIGYLVGYADIPAT